MQIMQDMWISIGTQWAASLELWSSQGVLTIYTGKPEIPVGRSNGSRHSVWEASENLGFDLWWCYFSALVSLSSWRG